MNQVLKQFYMDKARRLEDQGANVTLRAAADGFLRESLKSGYSYNFSWLGRPVIQYPEDLAALQEIIWKIKPALIVETGVAHGGSAVFFASMLELLGGGGRVLAVDVEIRPHNRPLIENHPLAGRIALMEADSLSPAAVGEAGRLARAAGGPVMVVLDSNHTHDHVLAELRLYGPLVTRGSYLVVYDGVVEKFPAEAAAAGRPWGAGNNPLTAVRAFLAENADFEVDLEYERKLLISAAPEGYLRRRG
ncbi:MAG: cephalosporin hydroxylase family protein [Candidatus Adiutrix sp.]|jgi:cephalosporin hydroxylase|nr:cephalosporin hydroxylase family protein [Candidatus Adiutrix sp.]